MKSSTIDVLLPVYNGSQYLKENIESVLSQSIIEFNFYICDDASTDNSLDILNSFTDPRIKLFKNENNIGLFPTLNKLLRLSNADVIHIWSQDDIMKVNCLEKSLDYYEKHKYYLAYSKFEYINSESAIIMAPDLDGTPEVINPSLFVSISTFYGSIAGNISNVCITRKTVEKFGYFREDLKVSADFEYWVRVGIEKETIHIKEAIVQLRNHTKQLSRKYSSMIQFIEEDYEVFESLFRVIQTKSNREVAQKYFKWKNEVLYFNNILYLISKTQFNYALQGLKIMSQKTNIFILVFRWLYIRILRIFNTEQKFYHTLIHKYIV